MQGGRSRRPLAIGLVLAAIAAAVVLAIVLSGGDDGEARAATAPTTTTETVTGEKTVTEETVTTETTEQQQEEQEVQQTVTTFVESSEQRDSQRACSLVVGAGGQQVEDCASAAGINLQELPSSDELDVSDVSVSGDRATAKLSNGASFSLKQSGGKWKISGFRPRRTGSGSGGSQAPPSS